MRLNVSTASVLCGVILLVCGCGGENAPLRPEINAHLEAYEHLIQEFEPRFAAARSDPPVFAIVANSYKERAQAWIKEWKAVAPSLSDAEGKAVRARIDELNRRAKSMLTG